MLISQRITPCLWFDDQAEAAAAFYISIFRNSKIVNASHFGDEGREFHGKAPGTVMTIAFELEGQTFTALNGGPTFKFNEAISFQVDCKTQAEVDYYWDKLAEDGDPKAQQCGWLKDRFGVSWQVVPSALIALIADPKTSQQATKAMLKMKKIDIGELERACAS